jgi:hypothetical protein
MGIQNAAITKVQSVIVHTGFVTGVLLNSVEEFTKYLTSLFEQIRTSETRSLEFLVGPSARSRSKLPPGLLLPGSPMSRAHAAER